MEEGVTVAGLSGRRAAEVAGISYRQLDYWARTDLIRPTLADAAGSGSRREYSYSDLLELRLVKTLLDAGIQLQQVRTVFGFLRGKMGQEVASANLVISGDRVYLPDTDGELIDVLHNGQGVLNVLSLGGVRSEIDAAIIQLCPEHADMVPDRVDQQRIAHA